MLNHCTRTYTKVGRQESDKNKSDCGFIHNLCGQKKMKKFRGLFNHILYYNILLKHKIATQSKQNVCTNARLKSRSM